LNGTDSTALGVGEKDNLRGGADGDTFILGETGLVYYDDGNNAGNGASDYALIWDYQAGVDTVQVAAGTYFLGTVSFLSGSTGLYLDTDGSGALNATDELIGIFRNQDLTGVAVGSVVTQV
jgi:hypothetical protein